MEDTTQSILAAGVDHFEIARDELFLGSQTHNRFDIAESLFSQRISVLMLSRHDLSVFDVHIIEFVAKITD